MTAGRLSVAVGCIAAALGLSACRPTTKRAENQPAVPHVVRVPVAEPPVKLPPEFTFTRPRVSSFGRLNLRVYESDTIALTIDCGIPKPIDREIRMTVGDNLHIRLALTKNAVQSITIRGAISPQARPSEYEDATQGTLICSPTDDPEVVEITLENLRFSTTAIPRLGPLRVQLDVPYPA